jgi:hypothetical protein
MRELPGDDYTFFSCLGSIPYVPKRAIVSAARGQGHSNEKQQIELKEISWQKPHYSF